MIRRATLAAFAAMVLGLAFPALAQVTGTIAGSVKDAQGGVVPGATVTLVSATRATKTDTVTNAEGNFVFPNVTAGTYTVRVALEGFKTVERPDIIVSPGDRVQIPALTIAVGSLTDTVTVMAESPIIQASSGERSYTVTTDAVANLPLSDRNFATLASLAPGVDGTARVGGGGATNFMMDGVGTMDTGSNRLLMAVNVESIAEVKVLASGYQAEYGRSSGLQITAVTKSGTNRFRGSVYDVEKNSDWNKNSKTNVLNGDPKTISKSKDWGYSIGGPIGKPGGSNKLFFFYSHEYQPRTSGNNVVRFRMPTALERAGDFSETLDNNGNRYSLIRDASTNLPCTAADTRGCFQDGGVLGKIPQNRLYQTGVNILKTFPMPNLATVQGVRYNYEITRPSESILGYQPAVRLDYQPTAKLRGTVKYTAWTQRKQTINGSIPGFNDSRMQNPVVSTISATANYNISSTMFLEGTWGRSANEQAGCALTGTPQFCTGALPMNPNSNRIDAGLGGLPYLFPNATVLNPDYYAYGVMNSVKPPIWDGTRLQMAPGFTWGGRVADSPPNQPFASFLNVNRTWDMAISLTKVAGRHTIKTGFYNTHSYKAQQRGGWNGTINFVNDTNNPLDSTFPYANAALGIFRDYNQASSYVEGVFLYNNTEGYIQDNWKVNSRLTLDYGVRLVHQQPQYDSLGQASNFLPEKWTSSAAPLLYVAGCVGASPCSGANRQAMDPRTGQLLGPNSVLSIGTLIPGSGNATNGLFLSGQGIVDTTYTWPTLAVGPRFGMAYDLTGQQRIVLRGGAGLFFDRPDGNAIFPQVQNPPTYKNITVRYGQLQSLSTGGLTSEGPPALAVYEYESKLPSSWQWNAGTQIMLPWATSLDVSWVGHHSYNLLQNVNLNTVDFGAAFLPQNQDRTLAPAATLGATAVLQDQMRALRGYGAIQQQWGRGWRTFHSLQLSFNRRFTKGVSYGFNDTISLYDHQNTYANPPSQNTAVRLQHNPDGSFSVRSDQAEADRLLGRAVSNRHIMKANVVWDLPDLRSGNSALKALGLVINDWRFASVWSGRTGSPYTVVFSYQNGGGNTNLTGSNDYAARVRVIGDPGSGCSSDPYKQFNTAAFQGPPIGSVGLESGNGYVRSCFVSTLDLSIARDIRLGRTRVIQLRVDMFNAPNAAAITDRNESMSLSSPNDPLTVTNLPFNADGSLNVGRSLPRNAGFGVANGYQNPRTVQMQIRFSF
jgi:Carboxypeptidase regulatory-like domain